MVTIGMSSRTVSVKSRLTEDFDSGSPLERMLSSGRTNARRLLYMRQ